VSLELRGITKTFGAFTANDSIDLKVETGQIHAILGENGAGKSTLMNIVYGLLKADSGEILIDGENTATFQESKWRKVLHNFGVVFQGAALFSSLNIRENVGIRLYEERKM
jgi:simple sugar transport system ATP-binding protein